MISREEKNKEAALEIENEKKIKIFKVIKKIFLICLFIIILLFLYASLVEPKIFKINEFVINNSKIPNEFYGIKILHFSDMLYDDNYDINLDELREKIELINPDLVLFTGDILKNENYDKEIVSFLKNIDAKLGKYTVLGERDSDISKKVYNESGFIILNNKEYIIYNDSTKPIKLIGLSNNGDYTIKNDDLFTISLIHNYNNYEKYNINSDIILSGHTLGCEIGFDIFCDTKYTNGYYEIGKTSLYVNSGLGNNTIRFNNYPSLNVYRLLNK